MFGMCGCTMLWVGVEGCLFCGCCNRKERRNTCHLQVILVSLVGKKVRKREKIGEERNGGRNGRTTGKRTL